MLCLTLFAIRSAIAPDGIDALRLVGIASISADMILPSYTKGCTETEAPNLPVAGECANKLWLRPRPSSHRQRLVVGREHRIRRRCVLDRPLTSG